MKLFRDKDKISILITWYEKGKETVQCKKEKQQRYIKAKVQTSPLALENPGLVVSAFFVQTPILTSFSYCNATCDITFNRY